jgi:hypothetical protein
MATLLPAGILYLDRNTLGIFTPGMAAMLYFTFPPEVIRDVEIIDKDTLLNQIKAIIESNNIQPANLTVLLSDNLLFSRDFQPTPEHSEEQLIKPFMEEVPFEHVASKTVTTPQAISVITTNKDFYETFTKGFKAAGFTVKAILPATYAGLDVNQLTQLTPDMVSTIAGKADSLGLYNFALLPATEKPPITDHRPQSSGVQQSGNKRLVVLVGVFGLLIGILAIVFLMSR